MIQGSCSHLDSTFPLGDYVMRKTLAFALFVGCVAAVQAQSFMEGFENGPADWNDTTNATFGNNTGGDSVIFDSGTWHFLNASTPIGITGWFNAATAVVPTHSGNSQAGANFMNTAGTGTISSWMMTPTVTLNNGDTFSFWTTTDVNTNPDRLHLKMSLAGASLDIADFSNTLVSVNPDLGTAYPTTHTQYSVTLSGLGGATSGRFAFHYDVTDAGPGNINNNGNYIAIDDVSYEAVPEPATMTLLGLGAIAAFRRRKA